MSTAKLDDYVVLLSLPHLREKDVARMENLREMTAGGEIVDLVPSFPAVTCPVQANMTTGRLPDKHGVIANGFYWRE
ncbi:MAG: alkaline phosphatase family protein, partial [Chloroflexi bacterium]|nr:alkaline phosphatase family protein [Chloroflexota bacterium]